MKSEVLFEAMSYIDDQIIENAYEALEKKKKYKSAFGIKQWCSVSAACLLLAVSVAVFLQIFGKQLGYIPHDYDASPFSAEDIASLFAVTDGTPTSSYKIVEVQSIEHLNLTPIPQNEGIPIYAGKDNTVIANCKRLSMEEAEEYLEKGYVFGGHSCLLCMALQDKVDFSDYDLVGMEYLVSKQGQRIPMYAFYKHIGAADNGFEKYAKTYVPAIKVNGIDEYFEKQKELHDKYSYKYDLSVEDALYCKVLTEEDVSDDEKMLSFFEFGEIKFSYPEDTEIHIYENIYENIPTRTIGTYKIRGNDSYYFTYNNNTFNVAIFENEHIVGLAKIQISQDSEMNLSSISFPKVDGEYQNISEEYIKAYFEGKSHTIHEAPVISEGMKENTDVTFQIHTAESYRNGTTPLFYYRGFALTYTSPWNYGLIMKFDNKVYDIASVGDGICIMSPLTEIEVTVTHNKGLVSLAVIKLTEDGYEVIRKKEYSPINKKYDIVPQEEIDAFFGNK